MAKHTYETGAKSGDHLRPMTKRQWNRYRWKCHAASRGMPARLVVWRVDGGTEFPWYHLQQIKNHAYGERAYAIEVYPEQSHVVNEQNYRHLWIVSEELRERMPDLWG